MGGEEAGDHARERRLAAAGFADHPEVAAALEGAADVADGDLARQPVAAGRAVAGGDVAHLEHGLQWRGLGRGRPWLVDRGDRGQVGVRVGHVLGLAGCFR